MRDSHEESNGNNDCVGQSCESAYTHTHTPLCDRGMCVCVSGRGEWVRSILACRVENTTRLRLSCGHLLRSIKEVITVMHQKFQLPSGYEQLRKFRKHLDARMITERVTIDLRSSKSATQNTALPGENWAPIF